MNPSVKSQVTCSHEGWLPCSAAKRRPAAQQPGGRAHTHTSHVDCHHRVPERIHATPLVRNFLPQRPPPHAPAPARPAERMGPTFPNPPSKLRPAPPLPHSPHPIPAQLEQQQLRAMRQPLHARQRHGMARHGTSAARPHLRSPLPIPAFLPASPSPHRRTLLLAHPLA